MLYVERQFKTHTIKKYKNITYNRYVVYFNYKVLSSFNVLIFYQYLLYTVNKHSFAIVLYNTTYIIKYFYTDLFFVVNSLKFEYNTYMVY